LVRDICASMRSSSTWLITAALAAASPTPRLPKISASRGGMPVDASNVPYPTPYDGPPSNGLPYYYDYYWPYAHFVRPQRVVPDHRPAAMKLSIRKVDQGSCDIP